MIKATMILDSINQEGIRLTTLEVTVPRFLVAQINTHRTFCLAGDSILDFDLPKAKQRGGKRLLQMTIKDFVDKWLDGNNRTKARGKSVTRDLSKVNPNTYYTSNELAELVGYVNNYNINHHCKKGAIKAYKEKRPPTNQLHWIVKGEDFLKWYATKLDGKHLRQDISGRLSKMNIRQLNEVTGEIQHSTVNNVTRSGVKPVYTLKAGKYAVSGSLDHLIKTKNGYTRLGDLKIGDTIVVTTKLKQDKVDPKKHTFIDGQWRSIWQKEKRKELQEQSNLCRSCNVNEGTDIHHIVPVHKDPALTYEPTNITLLCKQCHSDAHKVQGWQTGVPIVSTLVEVSSIEYRGDEMTYDLEIAGEFPNFIANGVVVHNSRNSASSRAIPIKQYITNVLDNPVTPLDYGCPANGSGMQPKSTLTGDSETFAKWTWNAAKYSMIFYAKLLNKIGLHKQWTNRLLEPFAYTTVLVSSTDWDNFMNLRLDGAAQDAMQMVAKAIKEALHNSKPTILTYHDWHLPYVGHKACPTQEELLISVSCCAQVSFRTTDDSLEKAKRVYKALTEGKLHASPFEHIAKAITKYDASYHKKSNYHHTWIQLRTLIEEDKTYVYKQK